MDIFINTHCSTINQLASHSPHNSLILTRNQGPAKFVDFEWTDPLNLSSLLTEEEIIVRDSARQYCQAKLMPRVVMAARNEGMNEL